MTLRQKVTRIVPSRSTKDRLLALGAALLPIVAVALVATQEATADEYTVVRVVDGDTVDVSSGLWSTTRVRLLNVDAPETVDPSRPVGCLGPEASQRLTELLPVGSPVDLAFDVERTDRYGRTLAGVYAKGELVNARMASEGLAVPVTVGSNTRFRAEVDASWQAANDKRLGLFAPIAPCTAPGQVQTLRNDVADLAESSAPQQASDAAAAAGVAKAVSDNASTLHRILLAKTASEVAALPQPVLSSLTHEVAGLASQSAATYNALLKKEASLRAQERREQTPRPAPRLRPARRPRQRPARRPRQQPRPRLRQRLAPRPRPRPRPRPAPGQRPVPRPRQRRAATSPQTRTTPRVAAVRAWTPGTRAHAATRRAARHGGPVDIGPTCRAESSVTVGGNSSSISAAARQPCVDHQFSQHSSRTALLT